jgi:hypothetical protein
MYHNLFTHSPTKGYLGSFQILIIMNKAAITTYVQGLCEYKFPISLDKYQGTWLLDDRIKMFSFIKTIKFSSKVAMLFCILTSSD